MRCKHCDYYNQDLNICPLIFKSEKNINYSNELGCSYKQKDLDVPEQAYEQLTDDQKQLCNIFMLLIEHDGILPIKYQYILKKPKTIDLCNEFIWLHIEHLLQSSNFNHVINALMRLDLLEEIFPQYYSLLEYQHIIDRLSYAFCSLSSLDLDIQMRRFITFALLSIECGIPRVNKAKRKKNTGHEQLGMEIIDKCWYHYQCPFQYIEIAKMACKLHEIYIKIYNKELTSLQLYDLVDYLTKFSNDDNLFILNIICDILQPGDLRVQPSFDILKYIYSLLYHKKLNDLPDIYKQEVLKYQVGTHDFVQQYRKQKSLYMESMLKEQGLYFNS